MCFAHEPPNDDEPAEQRREHLKSTTNDAVTSGIRRPEKVWRVEINRRDAVQAS